MSLFWAKGHQKIWRDDNLLAIKAPYIFRVPLHSGIRTLWCPRESWLPFTWLFRRVQGSCKFSVTFASPVQPLDNPGHLKTHQTPMCRQLCWVSHDFRQWPSTENIWIRKLLSKLHTLLEMTGSYSGKTEYIHSKNLLVLFLICPV